MLRISQLKLKSDEIDLSLSDYLVKELQLLKQASAKLLKINISQIDSIQIIKKSLDARKKDDIRYIYTVDVSLNQSEKKWATGKFPNITISSSKKYDFKPLGTKELSNRPVVVGSGPAGLFCALLLAEAGYRPIMIERGMKVEERVEEVQKFWDTKRLNPNCNVQFGEGGAGTFSDGKLNTVVKDENGRHQKVLEEFVKYGAPQEILYLAKPHIGTDKLRSVVKGIRQRIISLGGEVRFNTQLTNLCFEKDELKSIEVNHLETIPCEALVLAIGHSARDTFELLHKSGLSMKQKPFAIGVRIEHPQSMIGESQYGKTYSKLPVADYKLTYHASNGRSIYSFCMCPGGFVVNSSSEEGRMVVNGMSNYDRAERNANSALIVAVTPEDFMDDSPLAGVNFQRKWEELAFKAGKGSIPVQLYGDLCNNETSKAFGSIKPNCKGTTEFANLRECLPDYVIDTIIEGVQAFDKKIKGYATKDAVLSGVETRTSSPVRINRSDEFESNKKGVYPCGEGAGYAGGITSAAIDGIKVFEAIAKAYRPF